MKTIIVATDFSVPGNNAVRFAVNFATATRSTLVVFHSALLPHFNPTIGEADFDQLKRNTEQAQQDKLELLVGAIFRDEGLRRNKHKFSTMVRMGASAADTIIQVAKEQQAGMIVAGTHGATGLKWFGSTTTDIIFKADAPVMTIPPDAKFKPIKTMVYASDLKNLMNELRCIVGIAKPTKPAIEIFHLRPGSGNRDTIPDQKTVAGQLKYKGIRITVANRIKGKTIQRQLQEYLQKSKSDLLVMFPEERSAFAKLFVRSKTAKLADQAKRPMLTCLKSRVNLPTI